MAAWLAPIASRAGGDAPKPLRHLRYNINVGTHVSQGTTNFNGPTPLGSGASKSAGSIDADVIGLAADDALVFSVSENTDTRKEPPVKVGVLKEGQISADPKDASNLDDEEMALLTFLGRAVVADHDLTAGAEWRISHSAGPMNDSTTFRVVSLVGDTQVNLECDRTVKVGGAQPYDLTAHGKILYDYKRSVPISAELTQRMHQADGTSLTTTDMSFDYQLVEDSMVKT